MSSVDRLKEEVGWLKVVFVLMVATDISLVAWLVKNYEKSSNLLVTVAIVSMFALMVGSAWLSYAAHQKIYQLEEL